MKGMHYTRESYIQKQVAYFKSHARPESKLLGLELEHFLLDAQTLRSYGYHEPDGQHDLLRKLLAFGWSIQLEEDGFLLGIEKDGSTITLEPGGQVELSLKPLSSLKEIDEVYREILLDLSKGMKPNQILAGIGYHPVTKIDELPLLPKKRYGMMYEYFKINGRYCHNMMKGTAATQVSIDYYSEEDFIKKFRVANYLSPILASLFDATPFFEGQLTQGRNMRARIWAETDVKRSKLIPHSMDNAFGFADYANYLLSLPPILIYTDGELVFSNEQTLESAIKEYAFDDAELEHHTSMVFPDVRLKKYIEIRMPDALPYPYNIAVAGLIKAIFYNSEVLEKYYAKSLLVDDQWVKAQNEALKQTEKSCCALAYGLHVNVGETTDIMALKNELLEDAIRVLGDDERPYIENVKELISDEGSFTAYLQKLYMHDKEKFKETIKVTGGESHDL